MADPHEALHEALVEKYELLDVVGEGGMGTVYLARDRKHDRKVAIKTIHPELTTAEVRDRFEREIQITAHLQHPHILPLLDSGAVGDTLYYVMPYVEGESLRERLDREGQLPVDEAIGIVRDVAGALSYAHDLGVIHRDIKPENILLAAGRPVVSDFGIARAVDAAGTERLTKTGLALGSPGYMSPEQWSGDTTLDERSDVYSLACVAYEILGGEPPFRGPSPQAVLARVLTDPPPSLHELRASIPDGVERVVERALAKAAADRFETANGFAEALAEANTAQAIAEDARRNRRARRRRAVASVAAVGLVVAAGWWVTTLLEASPIERLAVLPPTNLMNDPEQEYLVQGVHNALISELQQAGIAVIARTSVMQYQNTDKPVQEIARELSVDALVEPTVLWAGDSVDVEVRLVDGETQEYLADPIVRRGELRNVMTLYRDLTRAIAGEIQSVLTPQAEARLASARPVDPEAYKAYLQGQFHVRRLSPSDLETGLRYFEAALERDPDYAMAYAGIARVWVARQQFGLSPPSEATPKAKAAALRALELDSTLAEAHAVNGTVRAWGEWDWESAETAFRQAIALNPNLPGVRVSYSHFLMFNRRPEEAMAQIERALKLDPLNAMHQSFYGMDLIFAGRVDDAIAQFRKTLATVPNHPLARSGLWTALYEKRMYPEALEEVKALYRDRGDSEVEEALSAGFAEGGYRAAMRLAAETLAARSRTRHVAPMRIARLYAHAGETDLVLDWLERAFELREPNLPYIGVVPLFDGLRTDPRFDDLLRRMNLPG
ncbi:MAG: protein kinase domain-containing protein [Planctomycetota bacterium]|jgi:serine/threonine-protein kinase